MQNLRRCLRFDPNNQSVFSRSSLGGGGRDATCFSSYAPLDLSGLYGLMRRKVSPTFGLLETGCHRSACFRRPFHAISANNIDNVSPKDAPATTHKRSLLRFSDARLNLKLTGNPVTAPLCTQSRLNSAIFDDLKNNGNFGSSDNRSFSVWKGHRHEDDGKSDAPIGRKAPRGRKGVRNPFSSIVKLGLKGRSRTRTPIDVDKDFTENVHLTTLRAMTEYLIRPEDLEGLPKFTRRSPFEGSTEITVYLRSDVENRAIEVWGSREILEQKKVKEDEAYKTRIYEMKRILREYRHKNLNLSSSEEAETIDNDPIVDRKAKGANANESIWSSGTGRVVAYAVLINSLNTTGKFTAWYFTGSHAMFSEAIHSLADTMNQIILGLGLYQSGKQPDLEHPYGYVNMRYVSCLISGVGIFCVGAGLSFYHGLSGLMNPPEQLESFFWAYIVLGFTFLSESVTLVMSINEIKRAALEKKMLFWEYVSESVDPSVNVVLLEDSAAVLGVGLAVSSMAATSLTNNPMWDSLGCCGVGVLLGGVASFIIYSNTVVLVGKSIPEDKKADISTKLENDRLIRALHDVKATDMGNDTVRFKAEVDFDGRELTRTYLDKQDLDELMTEMRAVQSAEDVEAFMLKHGENIVDSLGAEVDRIEKKLRQSHPELRHVDLEVL